MMLYYDYLLFAIPGMALSMWAQARISTAYAEGSRIPARAGVTGAEAASMVMQAGGATGVTIEPVDGELSDHYDPRQKVLRLSHGVYGSRSLSAVGIAAHEAGHAIQDASHYPGLVVRNLIVPMASIGSMLFWAPVMAGLFLGLMKLVLLGIILFSLTVVFQLVNLPVEFNASRRGRQFLQSTGLISPDEDQVVGKVLNAAAWTYVAATLTSVMTLLFYLVQFGLLGGRRRRD
jgi:Zn-dependent membrane protease YugP